MKNKLADLNNHLFEQLERLNDDKLMGDNLEQEIKRTDSMVKISTQILEGANTQLRAAHLLAEYGKDYSHLLPETAGEKPAGAQLKPVANQGKVR
jgi:hypothetical protein